jgi:hypothetical protein
MKTFLVLMLLASPALAGGTEVRGRVMGLPVLNGWRPPVVAQQDNVRVQAKVAEDGSFRFELEPGE